MASIDFVTFGLILDEIAFPDGRVARDVLGGGGPQTAFGLRLWAEGVGLVGRVGPDLPAAAWEWLAASGIDTAGLRTTAYPTLRARQQLDAQGGRTHTWQAPGEVVANQLARSLDDIPPAYRAARGFHAGLHPDEPDLAFLASLRRLGGVVSVETFRPAARRPAPEALRALLSAADIFSPALRGAWSLVGPGEPREALGRLLEAGASVVALRLGEQGSLVADARSAVVAHVPAVPVVVADPVGAGNAYCGGFLAGWVETGDVVEAGRRGAVAASFVVEQVGVPAVTAAVRAEAARRLNEVRGYVSG
jgi:sugar/nucleoside kinase (ribokinase family)